GDVGDARRVRLDADGEVGGDTIVAESAEPRETVPDTLHDALVFAGVALAVLPERQRGGVLGDAGDHSGREDGPIAAVNHERQRGGGADGGVVVDQAFERRV